VGTVQISQELMFPNPTFVNQEVKVQLKVSNLPSPHTAEIITNIVQPDGKMGCQGRALVWVPGARLDFSKASFEAPPYRSEAQELRGLRIGQVAKISKIFTQDDWSEYLDLVGETNPIYTNRDHAQSLGYQDVPLPGGLLGGIISDLLGTKLPGRGTNWLKQMYYFLQPAYSDEEITARVVIIRLRPEKDLVNLRTTMTNQQNEILVDGEALVWVSDLEK
jgi:acyl dehydratase